MLDRETNSRLSEPSDAKTDGLKLSPEARRQLDISTLRVTTDALGAMIDILAILDKMAPHTQGQGGQPCPVLLDPESEETKQIMRQALEAQNLMLQVVQSPLRLAAYGVVLYELKQASEKKLVDLIEEQIVKGIFGETK